MKELVMTGIYKNAWIDRLDRAAAWIPFLLGAAGLSVGVWYCLKNGSGHSGFSPLEGSACFLPITVAALLVIWHRRESYFLKVGSLGVTIAVMGALFGGFVHAFGIMREYGMWIDAGMPDQNPATKLLLFTYVGFALVVMFLVGCFCRSGSWDKQ